MPETIRENLQTTIAVGHPLIVCETVEEERFLRFVHEVLADLVRPLFDWSKAHGLRKVTNTGGHTRLGESNELIAALAHVSDLEIKAVFVFKDVGPLLDDPAVIRQLRETVTRLYQLGSTLILVGNNLVMPPEIEPAVTKFEFDLPNPRELSLLVDSSLKNLGDRHQFTVDLGDNDRGELVDALRGLTETEAEKTLAQAAVADGRLCPDDIPRILQAKADKIKDSDLLEYYPVDEQTAELGGFQKLKDWLGRAAMGFTPQAAELNLPAPSGILIVGVQGCGKSLCAKVISRRWKMPLIKLEAGRLYDKYIGESERNFRKAVKLVESVSPSILWIDEIEKAMATGDNDGGTSKRLLGAFLTWLQEKHHSVFVVGTANDLTALPPELLRKGRFDETFFVDLPTVDERAAIFDIHLRRRKQDPAAFDLKALVAATEGFSGAEIEQAVISGLYRALYHQHLCDTNLLLHEIKETVPLAVSRHESIERLRHEGRTRFVSVS